MSMYSVPGLALSSTPPSPSATASTCGWFGSMVITTSASAAACPPLTAVRAARGRQPFQRRRHHVEPDDLEPRLEQVRRHRAHP